MPISLLKLKQLYLGNGCSDRNNIFKESSIVQFWPYKAWWCQISPQKKEFWPTFQKWSLGTQESFCKVSDQLDTRLNNYGLISRHTSSINCINNCICIFTRHQPRIFLKAILVLHIMSAWTYSEINWLIDVVAFCWLHMNRFTESASIPLSMTNSSRLW